MDSIGGLVSDALPQRPFSRMATDLIHGSPKARAQGGPSVRRRGALRVQPPAGSSGARVPRSSPTRGLSCSSSSDSDEAVLRRRAGRLAMGYRSTSSSTCTSSSSQDGSGEARTCGLPAHCDADDATAAHGECDYVHDVSCIHEGALSVDDAHAAPAIHEVALSSDDAPAATGIPEEALSSVMVASATRQVP